MTGNGHVRGASTPFQFRKPGSEEYVEVEDEDDDNILIIKTKTAMLEDKLSKVDQEKEELSKVSGKTRESEASIRDISMSNLIKKSQFNEKCELEVSVEV